MLPCYCACDRVVTNSLNGDEWTQKKAGKLPALIQTKTFLLARQLANETEHRQSKAKKKHG